MTNRIDHPVIVYHFSEQEEIEMLRAHLGKMNRPVTLENARIVLALWCAECPGEVGLTLDRLKELWPEVEVVCSV